MRVHTVGAIVGSANRADRREYRSEDAEYTKVGGAQFWAKVQGDLERAADPGHDIPPEKKRKLLAQIHVLVERWRPFMAEIAPLFADFQRPASAAGPESGK